MADIRTAEERHKDECMGGWDTRPVGDVRRCPHGRIQEVARSLTYGDPIWRDLFPVLTPTRWWRARRALIAEGRWRRP